MGRERKIQYPACGARPTAKNKIFLELPRVAEVGKRCLKTVLPEAVVDWGKALARKPSIGNVPPKKLVE